MFFDITAILGENTKSALYFYLNCIIFLPFYNGPAGQQKINYQNSFIESKTLLPMGKVQLKRWLNIFYAYQHKIQWNI